MVMKGPLEAQMRVNALSTPSFSGRPRLEEGKPPYLTSSVRGWKPVKVAMTTSIPREMQVGQVDTSLGKVLAPYQLRKRRPDHIPLEKLEVIAALDSWAQENLLPLLKPVAKSWQPQDFLPNSSSDNFFEDVRALRERARELPDDYLVCLVGDMITEEALPTYQTMFNTFEGVRDKTGCSPTPWGVWIRAWTAEENRHGDLLNRYLYLCGRVDMRMVESTTQYLIGSGMEPQIDQNPYNGFVYTSFQERATFISHGNTARHAKQLGEHKLASICGTIAADEKRHEIAYSRIMSKIFELDPNGAMLSFQDMMKKKITMPAHLMYDGANRSLFDDYASVAQRCGVYTALDYASIMNHLIKVWNVESLTDLSSEAQQAQEFVCQLPARIHRLAERSQSRAKRDSPRRKPFSWIHRREVDLL